MTFIQAIARIARQARREAGLKQVHVAAALNADQSTVARFEKGHWPRDFEQTIRAYEEEVGISRSDLLGEALKLYASANGDGARA